MSDVPRIVATIRAGIRRAVRAFESSRRDEPPFETKWKLRVRVERDDLDGGWVAECVELPGCVSQGETEEEALDNLADAIGGVLAARVQGKVEQELRNGHTDSAHHEHEFDLAANA